MNEFRICVQTNEYNERSRKGKIASIQIDGQRNDKIDCKHM